MLHVTIHHALLTHDTDTLDKMDPYTVVCYGAEHARTSVQNSKGRRPVWNQSFTFRRNNNDLMLRLEVWDEDTFSRDDMIGQGQINLLSMLSNSSIELVEHPIHLYYEGKFAGRVFVTIKQQPGGSLGYQQGSIQNIPNSSQLLLSQQVMYAPQMYAPQVYAARASDQALYQKQIVRRSAPYQIQWQPGYY